MDSMPTAALNQVLMNHVAMSENGIVVLDPNNVIVLHNATYAGMFGFAGLSMVGRTLGDLMTWMYQSQRGAKISYPTLETWLAYVHSKVRSAPVRRFETDLIDGRWLLSTEQTYPDGYVVMNSVDITSQKKMEFELKSALETLERLAHTDELTNIPNRRHFLGQLAQELSIAQRYGRPLCLAMLDLDHFKQVNDRFGHPAGDQVLRHFAAFLRSHVRAADVLGRVGGEEFAVLLPETALADALLVLRRSCAALGAERIDTVAPDFAYTFSAGVAQLPGGDGAINCSALIARADSALYRAKVGGRNQVAAWQAP